MGMNAPQEIVIEVLGGRLLESGDGRSLRIHRAHHMVHRAIFSGCVERLQHDQQGVLLLGVQKELQLAEFIEVLLSVLRCLFFGSMWSGVSGVEVTKFDLASGLHLKLLTEIHFLCPFAPDVSIRVQRLPDICLLYTSPSPRDRTR